MEKTVETAKKLEASGCDKNVIPKKLETRKCPEIEPEKIHPTVLHEIARRHALLYSFIVGEEGNVYVSMLGILIIL